MEHQKQAQGSRLRAQGRKLAMAVWSLALGLGLYLYLFRPNTIKAVLATLDGAPLWALGGAYLALGCVRGFTLVPATYLVLAGMLVLAPVPLYGLTIAGIIVSSTAVYYFAEAMRFDQFFERRYARQVTQLRALLQRRELPIVILWSFFPLAPTDVVCYVCGALRVDLKKCLLGVVIGEGAICAIYIFLGAQLGSLLRALLGLIQG
jgi:uncharacterized membrane protein YdjX (TVP38/TMEM64 family)